MPATQPLENPRPSLDAYASKVLPTSRAETSSNLFVLNKDLTVAFATVAAASNAALIAAGASGDAAAAHVVPISHMGLWSFLDIACCIYRPNGTEVITGNPTVRIYGKLPLPSGPSLNNTLPVPKKFVPAAPDITQPWKALRASGGAFDAIAQAITGTNLQTILAVEGVKQLALTDFIEIPLQGSTEIMATTTAAGAVTAGASLLLVGRFRG